MSEPLKHVLVLDGERATSFLGGQSLAVGEDLTPQPYADSREPIERRHAPHRMIKPLDRAGHKNWDGIDPPSPDDMPQYTVEEEQIGPEELAELAIIRNPALRSRDGIQFYCFRERLPYGANADVADPNAQDPNHLEYWTRRLEEQLGRTEKLDAIVIPSAIGPLRYERLSPWIQKVRERWPDVKVMVIEPPYVSPRHAGPKGRASHYLIGEALQVPRWEQQGALVVNPNTPEFALGHGIDLAIKDARGMDIPNQLRGLIGVERLKEQDPYLPQVANREEYKRIKGLERDQRERVRQRREEQDGPNKGGQGRG